MLSEMYAEDVEEVVETENSLAPERTHVILYLASEASAASEASTKGDLGGGRGERSEHKQKGVAGCRSEASTNE